MNKRIEEQQLRQPDEAAETESALQQAQPLKVYVKPELKKHQSYKEITLFNVSLP